MKEIRKTFWDAISITGATALAIPLMIASESLQARGLGAEDYGRVALVVSLISLLYLFGLYWLRNAVMRFAKEEFVLEGDFRKTTGTLLLINMISFLIIVSLFLGFRQNIYNFLGLQLTNLTLIVILGVFLNFLKEYLLEVLKVIRKIHIQAIFGKFINKVLILLGLLLLISGIVELSVLNVVIVFLTADLLTVILSAIFIKLSYFFPLKFEWKLLKKVIIFSFPLLFASWSGYIVNWVDLYVINYFMSTEDVGLYHAAYKFLNAIQAFLGTSLIITISTPMIMVFKSTGQIEKIKNHYLKRIIPQLSFVGMIAISILILFSDYIFLVVYGADFDQSILIFKILVASQSFFVISAAYTGVITTFDLTKIILYLGILAGVLNILLDITLVPIMGIVGAAISSFLVFCLIPILRLIFVNRKFGVRNHNAFLFPVSTVIIMLINISTIGFVYRLIFTVFVLFGIIIFTKRIGIFRKADGQILDKIEMSANIRKRLKSFIYAMSARE